MSYVSKVVEFVAARRGSPTLISPSEYAAIAEWEKQEIPLDLVFGAYDLVLYNAASLVDNGISIGELDAAVSSKFACWLQRNEEAKDA